MYKFKAIQEPIATYRLHDSNLSNLNKKNEVLEFMDWLKKNKKTLKKEDYKKIKKKIMILKFISLKFEENFLKTFKFFLSSINSLSGVKNILILILPRFILKRFMWFL